MEQRESFRRKKKSATVSAVVSLTAHVLAAFFIFFWAAREGALGTKLQEITVALVPKEKPPELPPPPPPKIEPPKEEPKVEQPIEPPKLAPAPPPATSAAPAPVAVAPAPAVLPDFNFSDGAKPVEAGTNGAVGLYRYQVEYALRSNWERPENIHDDAYVAEVQLFLSTTGSITNFVFTKSSGDSRWDDSIKRAIKATTSISAPQPRGFPGKFVVRFDVLPASQN